MARFEPVSPDRMTDHQKEVCDRLIKSRGSVRGPFPVMLHNPGLAAVAEKFGGYARFGSKIEPRLLEFAISVVSRFWGAQVEWISHTRLAREAGIDPAVLKAVEEGNRPNFINEDEEVIYNFVTMLLDTSKVDDATYGKCLDVLGERGIIDLMAAITHYTVVSFTLNAFHVSAPEGVQPPPFGPGR